MTTAAKARNVQRRVFRVQRRIWLLEAAFWPVMVLLGLVTVAGLGLWVRYRRPR